MMSSKFTIIDEKIINHKIHNIVHVFLPVLFFFKGEKINIQINY